MSIPHGLGSDLVGVLPLRHERVGLKPSVTDPSQTRLG